MSQSRTECYCELALTLSFRDDRSSIFNQVCGVFEQCLRMRGLIAGHEQVDTPFLLNTLNAKKFGAVCFETQYLQPLVFVWGKVVLRKHSVILSVSNYIHAGDTGRDRSLQSFRYREIKRLLLAFAQAHYGVYPLEQNPAARRKDIFLSFGSGGNRHIECLTR